MKKKGFTLVELMVSVTVLMIILGSISLIMTSFSRTYNMGIRNEETGNSLQTFYAYLIKDIRPVEEEDEENFIEIKTFGTPVTAFEVRRSWYIGSARERVRYVYSEGELDRYEYRSWSDKPEGSRILKSSRNFDFTGIGIGISKSPLENRKKIGSSAVFEPIGEEQLKEGVRLGYSGDEEEERFNYYIEPEILLDDGSESLMLSRGYGLRFAPRLIEDEDGGSPEESLVWCGEVEDFKINKWGSEIDVDYKSEETGRYVEVILTGGDISRISSIEVAGQLLDSGKNNTYSGNITIPARSPFKIEIYAHDNGNREVDFSYLVYK